MKIKRYCYKYLSRSSIYRHRVRGRNQKLNILSNGNQVIFSNQKRESSRSDVEMAESSSELSEDENVDNEVYFDAEADYMHFDTEEECSDEEESISDCSEIETHSDLSDLETSETDSDPEDQGICNDSDNLSDTLYAGARITVGESLTTILKFYLRHDLSESCLSDLLQLIESHCPKDNKCAKTLYFFRKWLGKFDVPLKKHFHCSECYKSLKHAEDICTVCPHPKSTTYFISIPLKSQLAELFKREGFYNSLNYRFAREKENANNLEDIYDGKVYRSFCHSESPVDLRCQTNISFTWNTDGVPLYKSSKFSIWPQYVMINELPPDERKKPSNILLTSIWFGPKKPEGNVFLKPMAEDSQTVEDGITLYVGDLREKVTVKGVALCATCDLPAKALTLNMKRYNAVYSCHKCKIRTEAVGKKRSYRKTEDLALRTTKETERFAAIAVERKSSVFGIKGPTLMSEILPDHIRCTVIDLMHLLIGIVKLLFTIWFLSAHKDHRASIYKHFDTVRRRICAITPPSFIERLPRKIDDFAYWKASELITWLLMYSIPVLNGILDEEYLSHHKLLVFSIYLLCQKSISTDDIERARFLLHEYVANFEDLYGMEFMTCNVHSLLHLADLASDFGPLWVTTCFPFENANGVLKLLVHSTRDAQIQICRGVSMYITLDTLSKKYIREGSRSEVLYKRLEQKGTHRRKLQYVAQGIAIVGKPKKMVVVPDNLKNILLELGYDECTVYRVHCLMKDKIFYSSQSYTRRVKTNSSCVSCIVKGHKSIAIIETFLHISNCTCKNGVCIACVNTSDTLAVIRIYNVSHTFFASDSAISIDFIHKLESSGCQRPTIIPISQLKAVYFQITIHETGEMYAIEPCVLYNYQSGRKY